MKNEELMNYEMPLSRSALNALLLNLAHRYAAAAQEKLGDNLVSIALYGSVARGQATPSSDIDLFVVLQEAPSGMLNRRRLLQPVRDSLMPELEELWVQGIYADFIEVIRTRTEAQQFHPLYLDMSQEAVLLYDRDRFLETLLEKVRERLQRAGAERRLVGRYWYWDLKRADLSGVVV
ncbi:MAG TPA: nucleotidyltransferase domain-containing protein [Methanotrichaceae archaeon]|nr:nucleotidyltransferase domain-containing protein [Methanotrichaceae archaeon]HQF16006.1 nucleotidyltransferase domain-containing protein [Methanotrichaceae archaeon]HQI90646.1 nucleotidyltransferase domain-containing protein [Methanotrichaceae archaeon]